MVDDTTQPDVVLYAAVDRSFLEKKRNKADVVTHDENKGTNINSFSRAHLTPFYSSGMGRRPSSFILSRTLCVTCYTSLWTTSGSFLTRCIFKTVPVEEADKKLYKKSVNNVWINCEKLCIYIPRKMAGKLVYTNNDSNSNNVV